MLSVPSIAVPWIKICGFTDIGNAAACAVFSPDAMGFVFFEKSPRNVSVSQAREIIAQIPETILPVGVFVDKKFGEVVSIASDCGLKGIQLHGKETPEMVAQLKQKGFMVIKALFAKKEPSLDQADDYPSADALLVEYGEGKLPGGNAEAWNYELARRMKTERPVILAGGLGVDSVGDACRTAMPFGVDVSSGVEASPGIKDPAKVQAFIENARQPV